MTNLKTLKDFEEHIIAYERDIAFKETFLFTELKAEAIKWFHIQNKNIDNEFWVAVWIQHFFNLSEEDLK